MDRGESDGGLPPDNIVESTDDALSGTEQAIDGTTTRPAARICRSPSARARRSRSPSELMTGAAELARRHGRPAAHASRGDVDEEEQCRAEVGCTPAEYADKLGWLGDDVWLAHAVHLDAPRRSAGSARPARGRALPDVQRPHRRRHRAGRATCWPPARRSGSAWTGPRPTSPAGSARSCTRRCCSPGSARRPDGADRREALWMATHGRRPVPGPRRRHRLAGAGQARRPRRVATWTAWPTRASPIRWRRWCWARRRRCDRLLVGGAGRGRGRHAARSDESDDRP